jgi:pSer/pThr/pTyr-binding forkhead associated (FHA) protein
MMRKSLASSMAMLRRVHDGRTVVVSPEHLVGRGPQCALRLDLDAVSSQHAVVRWGAAGWEVIDRGSHNGTRLNGQPLAAGRAHALKRGDILTFGHPDEAWELVDASEPGVGVLALDTGQTVDGVDGVIGVPSSADPQGTVFRDMDGRWKLELPDQPVVGLQHGSEFEVAGRRFRLLCPTGVSRTATSDAVGAEVEAACLLFSVSSDEEFVELAVRRGDRVTALGTRSHNYLLLTLARARLKEADLDLPPSAHGWVDKEELADALRMTPPQIDGEVFRIRQHFGQHGLDEAATIIERRPRTRQLRLGLSRIVIERM